MIRTLAALLVAQLGVAAYLYWPESPVAADRGALAAGIAYADVDRIAITDTAGTTATLTRAAENWTFEGTLPADPGKIDTLLASLLTSDAGLAIATSDGASARFRVAEDSFERRIVLSGGGEATVYLGSSPSFRKIHARREGSAKVYIIEMNSYDAPIEAGAWLDRALLAVEDPRALDLYGVQYERGAGEQGAEEWSRGDGGAVDEAAMEQLLQALRNLRVSGLVDKTDESAQAAGETLRITVGSGEDRTRITLLDNPETERYYLSSDRYTAVFDTSAFDAERLIEAAKAAAGIEEAMEIFPVETEPDV